MTVEARLTKSGKAPAPAADAAPKALARRQLTAEDLWAFHRLLCRQEPADSGDEEREEFHELLRQAGLAHSLPGA